MKIFENGHAFQAKENNLMEVDIYVESDGEYSILNQVMTANYWNVDDQTDASLQWDIHRSMALKVCLEKFLFPLFAKETHDFLLVEAKECVRRVSEMMRNYEAVKYCLASILGSTRCFLGAHKIGSLSSDFTHLLHKRGDSREHRGERAACAHNSRCTRRSIRQRDDGNRARCARPRYGNLSALVSSTFRSEHEKSLWERFDTNKNFCYSSYKLQREAGNVSLRAFIQMCRTHRPHVIAVAATDMQAIGLSRDLKRVIKNAVEETRLIQEIPVRFVSADASKVYAKSRAAEVCNASFINRANKTEKTIFVAFQREFPTYSQHMRLTISVGRFMLDPLIEYAHLCNDNKDYLGIRIHPLQEQLAPLDLEWCFQRAFIDQVSEVGVDINYCLEFPHTADVLQFVCGLGPRKAAHMLQLLQHQNVTLDARSKLVTLCNLGPNVFINAAGFIRIDVEKIRENADEYVEPLDGSRVHPETYAWARKMAIDALEFDESNDPASAIDEIIAAPDRLEVLDLDAFSEELERQGFGIKATTLYDIRAELHNRYKDLRKPPDELEGMELFRELVSNPELFMQGERSRSSSISGNIGSIEATNPSPARRLLSCRQTRQRARSTPHHTPQRVRSI